MSSSTQEITFPKFVRYRVEGRLPLVAVLIIITVVLISAWPRIALLSGAGVAAVAGPMLLADVRNAWRRRAWARGGVSASAAVRKITAEPGAFRLHVRYHTAFGMNSVSPVAVLEHLESGRRQAIGSGIGLVITACEASGSEIVHA